jgi:hypothetical protein
MKLHLRASLGYITKQQMLDQGGSGYLDRAFLCMIPVLKIEGREPNPAASDEEGYKKGRKILVPIEVEYRASEDLYYLYAGNHRVVQAEINGDQMIKAWVQPDQGRVGPSARKL